MAALYVVVYHFVGSKPDAHAFWSPNLFTHGYIAVDFFFVMSGFVLALTYGDAFAGDVTFGAFRSFLRRRLARIYPLYAFLCVVNLIFNLTYARQSIPPLYPLVVVANFGMMQSWFGVTNFETPMWSISTEWAAYLCFPVLLRCAFGKRSLAVPTFALCIATLIALALLPAWSDPNGLRDGKPLDLLHEPSAMLARCFAEFVLGILAVRVARGPLALRLEPGTASVAIAAAIVAFLAIRTSDVALVVLFTMLVIVLARDRGPVARVLSLPIAHTLGVWSYAIYLVAPIVQSRLLPGCIAIAEHVAVANDAVALGIALSMVPLVALSYLAHRFVERPGRRIVRRGLGLARDRDDRDPDDTGQENHEKYGDRRAFEDIFDASFAPGLQPHDVRACWASAAPQRRSRL